MPAGLGGSFGGRAWCDQVSGSAWSSAACKTVARTARQRQGVLKSIKGKRIIKTINQVGGIFLVTADHGNAEDMIKRNKSGQPLLDRDGNVQINTSNTCHPVPIAIGGPGLAPGVRFRKDLPNAGLANVAATIINLHGFEAPSDYEPTLIEVVDG